MSLSPVEIGNDLRDYVIDLLEADGLKVSREERANTKRVDIILTLDDEYVPRAIAIECKNLDRTISQNDLAVIAADYQPVIRSRRVNEVWVIARRDFSPEAKNWANETPELYAFTLAEFEERRYGFRRYVRQLRSVFKEGDLDQYYIQQRLPSGEMLSDHISRWLESDDAKPIAILGGYGMGKTSFCRYLVDRLSELYLNNPRSRVPIYVRLSDIARQQELDGLIAKTLADRYRIQDYYFEKFKRLNEKGKFVLIFDGFDEMKHALSWAEFKFNFTQINSTIVGRAKVLVAGRPNAFLSDDEHSWVLRGVRLAGERMVRLPDWPEYTELEIQPFTSADAENFLRLYLAANLRLNPLASDAAGAAGPAGHFSPHG